MKLGWFWPRFYWDPFPPSLVSVDVSLTPKAVQPYGYVLSVYLGIWRLRFRFAVWRDGTA
jgi:hypothetical protein